MKASAFAPLTHPARFAIALGVVYFALHLPFLAPSLEDIDSINFALGLRDFDVAAHQPHPPGYPVYMALARLSRAVVAAAAPTVTGVRAEALALAIWSAVGGAVALVAAWALFGYVGSAFWRTTVASGGEVASSRADGPWHLWAVGLLAGAPLFWMSGLRPMSDMTGLAMALVSQALAVRAWAAGAAARAPAYDAGGAAARVPAYALVAAAAVAGLAAGIRAQTVWLTLPLLVGALVAHRGAGVAWLVSRPIAALAAAGLAWAIPLVAASGGIGGYLAALGTQADEDFAWVDMLLFNPAPRRVAFALLETFVLPWSYAGVAVAVLALAAVGAGAAAVRDRRALTLMALAFAPYTVFHLLLQETVHIRYALPVLVPIVWLAQRGVSATAAALFTGAAARPAAAALAATPIVVLTAFSIGAGAVYAAEPHPAFRAIAEARAAVSRGDRPDALFSHYALRRPLQADRPDGVRLVEPRRSYEWLDMIDYWVGGGRRPVWFFADPKRTDLALIDPQSRRAAGTLQTRYRWMVAARPELSGARPLGVDWYRFDELPGWFAAEGWSLTPETGGLARATTMGVDHVPIEAYVRRRGGPMRIVVGVRHLGDGGDPAADFALAIDGMEVERWRLDLATGQNDLRFIELPGGLPPGDGDLALLSIAARSAAGGPTPPVAVRQFDTQSAGPLVHGFGEGWHEAEYDTATGRSWRWTSERSVLRVAPAMAVRLTLVGESPMRYVDAVPTVRVMAGDRIIAELHPAADFTWTVTVPADAVAAAGGAIAITTDKVYLPGLAEGTADVRRLGLRLFEVDVNTASP